MIDSAEARSYYGKPVLAEPVWTWEIPLYFFAGGMGGAAAGLALGAELAANHELAKRAWLVALAGVGVSPALLISDLGRPARFPNMLRVFKVTSPMSVGSWILTATGAATSLAAARATLGLFSSTGRLASVVAGVLGMPLSTYTATLISNTAVPAWHEARRELPFVFAGGAAASAGAAVGMVTPARHAGPARRLALGGLTVEMAAVSLMHHNLGELAEPYRRKGPASRYSKLARSLNLAGAGVLAFGGPRRAPALAGGALALAGAVCERWSIFKAGIESANDPRYTVGPQRERRDRGARSTRPAGFAAEA